MGLWSTLADGVKSVLKAIFGGAKVNVQAGKQNVSAQAGEGGTIEQHVTGDITRQRRRTQVVAVNVTARRRRPY